MNQELRIRKKIKSFTDIEAWKKGHTLAINIFKITKSFPEEEKFIMLPQIRRASVSVTSNIAEGFSRGTYKEKVRFYYIALGSLTELQNQLLLARDLGYIKKEVFKELADKSVEVSKIMNGLIRCSKEFILDS